MMEEKETHMRFDLLQLYSYECISVFWSWIRSYNYDGSCNKADLYFEIVLPKTCHEKVKITNCERVLCHKIFYQLIF